MKQSKKDINMPLNRCSTPWTPQQLNNLKEALQVYRPQNQDQWKQICIQMHQSGSRRTLQAYKNKAKLIEVQDQRINIISDNNVKLYILNSFQAGMPPAEIAKNYKDQAKVLLENDVRNFIGRKLQQIYRVMKKIQISSLLKIWKVKDYQLFAYIRQRELPCPSLAHILEQSKKWREADTIKNWNIKKKQQMEPQKQLKQYNQIMKTYAKMFEGYFQIKKHVRDQKNMIPKRKRSSSVVLTHLAEEFRRFSQMQDYGVDLKDYQGVSQTRPTMAQLQSTYQREDLSEESISMKDVFQSYCDARPDNFDDFFFLN